LAFYCIKAGLFCWAFFCAIYIFGFPIGRYICGRRRLCHEPQTITQYFTGTSKLYAFIFYFCMACAILYILAMRYYPLGWACDRCLRIHPRRFKCDCGGKAIRMQHFTYVGETIREQKWLKMEDDLTAPGVKELAEEILRRKRMGYRTDIDESEFTTDVTQCEDMDAWGKYEKDKNGHMKKHQWTEEELRRWISVAHLKVFDPGHA
jgi:hypothetical protein